MLTTSCNQAPRLMGILNVTPDSFSDGGQYLNPQEASERARQMIDEGVDVIDIGGESTRPGAKPVSVDEECRRVLPVIRAIRSHSTIPISVDTTKSEVARLALEEGALMINDISALRFDPAMIDLVVHYRCPIALMHMQGTPQTMQSAPGYHDVVGEVLDFLVAQRRILIDKGISPDHIWLDPGIGFGKTLEHNVELIKHIHQFNKLGSPVLLGTSRKSFLGVLLGQAPVSERLEGSLASVAATYPHVGMYRIHDVGATRRFLTVLQSLS